MDSKFNLGDLVLFEGQVYVVRQIAFMNPNILSDPYVCSIVRLEDNWDMLATRLLVREGLLQKCNQKGVKVLYGQKPHNDRP
jgi:hypothetical protein